MVIETRGEARSRRLLTGYCTTSAHPHARGSGITRSGGSRGLLHHRSGGGTPTQESGAAVRLTREGTAEAGADESRGEDMSKRRVAAAASVIALVAAVGAYAYWTQGGTGTGSATAGSTSALTVNQTNTVTGLYPGGTAAALSGNFTNPNASAVTISSITASVSSVSNGASDGSKPACTAADFSIGGSFGGTTVPAGPGTVGSWSGLTIQLLNTAANQDNCKGATANIAYTANP